MKQLGIFLVLTQLITISFQKKRKRKEKPNLQKQLKCNNTGIWVSYDDEFDDIEKKVKDPNQIPVEEIEMRIRKKGTITLSIVNPSENLNNPNNSLYNLTYTPPKMNYKQLLMLANSNDLKYTKQSIKELAETPSTKNKSSIYFDDEMTKKNLFLLNKIELPYFCSVRLSPPELTTLAQQGPSLLSCWLTQNPLQNITYIVLPYLCPSQVLSFYQCVLDVYGQSIPTLDPSQARPIMTKILFGNQLRDRMSWLDFMGYLCSRGVKEKHYSFIDMGILTVDNKTQINKIVGHVNKNAELLLPKKKEKEKKLIYIYKGMKGQMTRLKHQQWLLKTIVDLQYIN